MFSVFHEAVFLTKIILDSGHENSAEFELKINELLNAWKDLKEAMERRKNKLAESEKAHQVCESVSFIGIVCNVFKEGKVV